MKNYSTKTRISLDFFELTELKDALSDKISKEIRLNKSIGVKFPYYEIDKDLLKLYKKVIKQFKSYRL